MKHNPSSRYSLGVVLLGLAVPITLLTTVIAQTPANSVPAAPKPAAGPAKMPNAGRSGDVIIRNSEKGKYIYDQQSGIHKVTDNVRVYQTGEDFILYADELTYNEKTNEAFATGHLRLESRDSTLTGKIIRANFNNKVIVVLDSVVMKSHGTSDGIKSSAPENKKTDKKNGAASRGMREELAQKASVMTCERIDYNYENREALVSGNIQMQQGKNSGTCEQIVFDEERNIAQLRGSVAFVNDKQQKIVGREVIVWMDDNRVATDNSVQVRIPSKENEQDPAATKKTAKTKFPVAPTVPEEWVKALDQPIGPAPTPVPVTGPGPVTDDAPQLDPPQETETPTETAPTASPKPVATTQ